MIDRTWISRHATIFGPSSGEAVGAGCATFDQDCDRGDGVDTVQDFVDEPVVFEVAGTGDEESQIRIPFPAIRRIIPLLAL